MSKSSILYLSGGLILAVFLALFALSAAPSHAQISAPPALKITEIGVDSFPDVSVLVFGQNLGADLGSVPLTLTEDGQAQAVTSSELVGVGTQTMLLLDASTNIGKPGVTGAPRFQEVIDLIVREVDVTKVLSPQSDWLAAYAPAAGERITPIKEWTTDHGFLRNNFYIYEPPEKIGQTPLFELIYFGLDAFNDPQLDPRAQRAMILFSDGIDDISGVRIDEAIARAHEMGVTIHTVLLGEGTREGRANMERIASMTGGQYTPLTSAEALDPVWSTIAQGRQQRRLSYRTRNPQPRELAVAAQLAQGTVTDRASFPVLPPPPPVEVQIVQPAPEQEIVRSGEFHTTTLAALTPDVLPVQATFTWPDGRPRALQRVEYTLGSDTRVVEMEPFDRIDFPIAAFGNGSYALRVQAVDELGIVGTSRPLSVKIAENRPTPPLEEVLVTLGVEPCEGLLCPDNMRWLTLAALALALLALFFAIFVLLRKPAVRMQVQQAVTGTIKAVTQPFTLDRRMKGPQAAKARLVLVEGDASLPQSVEIVGSNTRIGRDSSLSNVVLDDPRVSRYHCRIAEEGEDIFRIYDEGSTSGTYVNYKPVDIRGQVLQHGDQVHIGPIGMRFEVSRPGERPEPSDAATEPYMAQFDVLPDDDPFRTEPFRLQTPERKDGQ